MSGITRREFGLALAGSAGLALTSAPVDAAQADAPQAQAARGSITDVAGIKIGQWTDSRGLTGCTVLLFDDVATAAVDYDGSAPGESQVVLLQPVSPIEKINGLVITGGGPFGLSAVPGATRYLEERKTGFRMALKGVPVPIVVGAVISDLDVTGGEIRPDAESAYKACLAASSGPVGEGNVGAGAGATVGKMLARQGFGGMKGGLGAASVRVGDVTVGALVVVNAAGDIWDWRRGKIIAGARRPDGKGFANIVETVKEIFPQKAQRSSLDLSDPVFGSTTIAVVATNADFNKTQLLKIAMMANAGAGRAIIPYHTTGDGDQLFAVSTNKLKSTIPLWVVGALAAEVAAEAIARAAKAACSIEGWPAYRDYTAKLR